MDPILAFGAHSPRSSVSTRGCAAFYGRKTFMLRLLLWLSLLSSSATLFSSRSNAALPASPLLQTQAEQSQWRKTGRYEEVEKFGKTLQNQFPRAVRLVTFGESPEGRPLWALILSQAGLFEPSAVQRAGRTIVLVQGGIHAGEIDGKDASLAFARDVLQGKVLPGLLKDLTLVIIPVFNVDGHERFQAFNRPNQNGPEEMGWRTTAQNFNLNRDYLKAEAPEMQAMLRLMNAWDPILAIDLHVTDGAKFQHDIAVMVEPASSAPPLLKQAALNLSAQVMLDLKRDGHQPLWFYPSFREEDKPESGFVLGPQSPRFSNGYWGLRQRLGVLVETHSWRSYAERVQSTYHALTSLLSAAQSSGRSWRQAAAEAARDEARLAGRDVVLSFKTGDDKEIIDFAGYAYTRGISAISGQSKIVYDDKQPVFWKVPLLTASVPELTVHAPGGGYLIPRAYRWLWESKLKLHDIQFSVIKKPMDVKVEEFRFESAKLSDKVSEGRQRVNVTGGWKDAQAHLVTGSLWVPIRQARAKLLMQLIEPLSAESLLAWGFMNQVFERKEYMEDYVTEEIARTMLEDPRIKEAFAERMKDPEFAKNPHERLDFFYRRHPSFDRQWNLYPIVRLATPAL